MKPNFARPLNRPVGAVAVAGALIVGWSLAAHAQNAMLWSDEFDIGVQPNMRYWSYDRGGGGWGNNELQIYTDDPPNVRVESGSLLITALENAGEEDRGYTSARMKTEGKLTVRYGIVEARIRVPNLVGGLWPAFWTLGSGFAEVGWPDSGELDIIEMGSASAIAEGVENRSVHSGAHWEHEGAHAAYGLARDLREDLSAGFHVYRMEWTPERVSTSVDGQLVWAMDISLGACSDCAELHQPHFLILNLAVGGHFPRLGTSREITAEFPAVMEVDWIRILDNGFTELGGSFAR